VKIVLGAGDVDQPRGYSPELWPRIRTIARSVSYHFVPTGERTPARVFTTYILFTNYTVHLYIDSVTPCFPILWTL